MRSRARQMAGVLGVDAIEDVDALLEEQGVEREAGEAKTLPLQPNRGAEAATRYERGHR